MDEQTSIQRPWEPTVDNLPDPPPAPQRKRDAASGCASFGWLTEDVTALPPTWAVLEEEEGVTFQSRDGKEFIVVSQSWIPSEILVCAVLGGMASVQRYRDHSSVAPTLHQLMASVSRSTTYT